MRLLIDGVPRDFTPVAAFRAEHGLPPTFGAASFEPKTYEGLGSIEGAAGGAALHAVRAATLAAVPQTITLAALIGAVDALARVFEAQLIAVNDAIGLREPEIGFAVGGFSDVCRAYAYALVRGKASREPMPSFDAVYGAWLNDTVRVSEMQHPFEHEGQAWRVRLVTTAYGRAGLIVQMPDTAAYVADHALACPAEGFMAELLRAVAARLSSATAS